MDVQKLVDAMGAACRQERSNYHLTLGEAINGMKALNKKLPVVFDDGENPMIPSAHSYRGYYSDLAISAGDTAVTVDELVEELQSAFGNTYEGYKGGDFVMGRETPLWKAPYGCCGSAIVGMTADESKVTLITKDVD